MNEYQDIYDAFRKRIDGMGGNMDDAIHDLDTIFEFLADKDPYAMTEGLKIIAATLRFGWLVRS